MKRAFFINVITTVCFFVIWGSLESLFLLIYKGSLITLPVFSKALLLNILIYASWAVIVGGISGGFFLIISHLRKSSSDIKKMKEFTLFVALFNMIYFYVLLKLQRYIHNFAYLGTHSVILFILGIAVICIGLTYFVFFSWRLLRKNISIGKKQKIILAGLYILTMTLSTIFGTSNIEQRINSDVLKFSPEEEKPNILLITIDTLRSDYLSCYGNSIIKTPHIDQVAKEGVLFTHAITPIPITGPSHISLMTSLLPRTHGARVNGIPYKLERIVFAEIMKSYGYHSAAFISSYPLKVYNSGLHKGFDIYDESFGFFDFNFSLLLVRFLNRIDLLPVRLEQKAEETNNKAIRWLEKNYNKPFFLWIHYFDPHYPYDPPESYNTIYRNKSVITENDLQKALYGGEISYTDEYIGKLINQLKTLNIYDDTLLIITADHGESLGEHNFYYDHSEFLYEQLIRVPLIMRYPPLLPRNKIINEQVQIIDILPTVLSILNIDTTYQFDGQDLLSLFNKTDVQSKDLNFALAETFSPEATINRTAIRTNRWKLIINKGAQDELYNLEDDPDELINLSNEERAVKQILYEKLQDMMSSIPQFDPNLLETDIDHDRLNKLRSLGYLQ
jgi:arylsulfatase A-like enzyme